jgi:antitoxin VapB
MTKSIVTRTSDGQAVRLPKSMEFPSNVHQVRVVKLGRSQLVSPLGHSWDVFFDQIGTGNFPDRDQRMPKHRVRL